MIPSGHMKSGLTVGVAYENMFPETFFIIYLILGAILRRNGFKDSLVYSEHNNIKFNQEVFDSGVLFNLLSEYGVGKSLEPLIRELFRYVGLDPETNKDNIFFKEIVRLTSDVSKIVRTHDSNLETRWVMDYAINYNNDNNNNYNNNDNNNKNDPISIERETRLLKLFNTISSSNISNISNGSDDDSEDNISDSDDDDSEDISYSDDSEENNETLSICECSFCLEFRKYHIVYDDRNVTEILNNVLIQIAKELNN